MKNFYQWAENQKIDLSFLEQPEKEADVKSEDSTKRAGVRPWAYPELYARGQYPKGYMRPIAADAVTYQNNPKY